LASLRGIEVWVSETWENTALLFETHVEKPRPLAAAGAVVVVEDL
jgi:hypothetical protein